MLIGRNPNKYGGPVCETGLFSFASWRNNAAPNRRFAGYA